MPVTFTVKTPIACADCGAESTRTTWRSRGFVRFAIEYSLGRTRRRQIKFLCADCAGRTPPKGGGA